MDSRTVNLNELHTSVVENPLTFSGRVELLEDVSILRPLVDHRWGEPWETKMFFIIYKFHN